MDAERNAVVLDLYRKGVLLKDIATEAGISPAYVGRLLKDMGIERPTKPQKQGRHQKHADADDRIKALWDQGLAAKHIAERLGYSRSSVQGALSRLGVISAGTRRVAYESNGGGGTRRQAAQRIGTRG